MPARFIRVARVRFNRDFRNPPAVWAAANRVVQSKARGTVLWFVQDFPRCYLRRLYDLHLGDFVPQARIDW
jgi:hypothetical protein